MNTQTLEITYNLTELDAVASQILNFSKHKIVLIDGEMGSGKTTLVKSLVKSIGSTDLVSSPTFSLVNEYQAGKEKIYHFDFYRINKIEEVLDMGFEEYLDQNAQVFIEWAHLVLPLISQPHTSVILETTLEENRKCTVVNS